MSSEESRELSAELAAYGDFVTRAVVLTRSLQVSHLKWYWDMGALVVGFIADQAKFGDRNLENLAADLKGQTNGVEIGTSTLYCARSINLHYTPDELDKMVARGVTVGHLKLMIPLKDEAKASVTKKLYGADGKAITIKQLDDIINDTARQDASASVEKAEGAVKASKAAPTPPKPPTAEEIAQAEQPVEEAASPAAPAKPDDGKAGTRGATPQKEFSQPPLKVLKTIDNAAIKLTANIGDAIIVVHEATKVGFDSDKAQKNYREAFNAARASLRDAIESGQKLLEAMQEAEKDI